MGAQWAKQICINNKNNKIKRIFIITIITWPLYLKNIQSHIWKALVPQWGGVTNNFSNYTLSRLRGGEKETHKQSVVGTRIIARKNLNNKVNDQLCVAHSCEFQKGPI